MRERRPAHRAALPDRQDQDNRLPDLVLVVSHGAAVGKRSQRRELTRSLIRQVRTAMRQHPGGELAILLRCEPGCPCCRAESLDVTTRRLIMDIEDGTGLLPASMPERWAS